MLIEHWDAFYEQALALYRQNPLKTRFVTKYRHCDGKLWLKVTDDATVRPRERVEALAASVQRVYLLSMGPRLISHAAHPQHDDA